ncbi:hypothetical protein AB0C34_15280, partial [Nocardia sp. NPDC049220]|uniref:hypothetical protein n=1 Tax=Nocardia sp. NPDC049220 TaxID=3155273 RepID=UPI00340B2DB4
MRERSYFRPGPVVGGTRRGVERDLHIPAHRAMSRFWVSLNQLSVRRVGSAIVFRAMVNVPSRSGMS